MFEYEEIVLAKFEEDISKSQSKVTKKLKDRCDNIIVAYAGLLDKLKHEIKVTRILKEKNVYLTDKLKKKVGLSKDELDRFVEIKESFGDCEWMRAFFNTYTVDSINWLVEKVDESQERR